MVSKKNFLKEYCRALELQTAGLFVGAGLSVSAGYPSWSKLLEDVARELDLDIDREHDLVGIAQYHLNKANRTRTRLAQIVRDAFPDNVDLPEVYRVLARLPVGRIWTTNYDRLLERAFEEQHKKLDVKSRNKDLATWSGDASAILLKMHGTVDHPTEVVIAKDDYESYARRRARFLQALSGDFINRTLLFLGFSFTDPNLYHLMALIRASFDDTPPLHFTIVRRPKQAEYKGKGSQKRFDYDKNRFELWIDDLQRYGIQAVVVDEYDEIREILAELEGRYAQRSLFVSGAYPDEGGSETERNFIAEVAKAVGRLAAKLDFRLVSGFGLTVGNHAIMGMMEKLYEKPIANLDRRLLLRPFPSAMDEVQKRRYREDMLSKAGVCVVVGGMRDGADSPGVIEEVEIALDLDRIVIPLGATGWAASSLWKRLEDKRPEKVTKSEWKKLNSAKSVSELVQALEAVLKELVSDPVE